MRIKLPKSESASRKAIGSFFSARHRLKWVVLAVAGVLLLSGIFVSGMYYAMVLYNRGQARNFLDAVQYLSQTKAKVAPNYLKGLMAEPERVVIDVNQMNFQRLAYRREAALANGILTSGDYVPASIRYGGRTYKVKLRLKGDIAKAHLGRDKWSFRVKVSGDNTIMGMKVYSLQHPKTRNYIHEWIYHQALKREGVISLRYMFVDVTVNGKDWGIYALEEHFEKRLIESNEMREGPILKFNEDMFWDAFAKGTIGPHSVSMYASNVDVFKKSSTLADATLRQQFLTANNLLESFRNGNLPTSKVFDVEKLARFFAVSDLMGASHGSGAWHNMRFYYNPVTSLLEPIGFDGNAGQRTSKEGLMAFMQYDGRYLHKAAFADREFYEKYLRTLERISRESYLDDLFTDLRDGLEENLGIIYKEFPYYHFSTENYYLNRKMIRNVLDPMKGLHAHLHDGKGDSEGITLELGNIQFLPIELLGVSYKGSQLCEPNSRIVLPGREPSSPPEYASVRLTWPDDFEWSEDKLVDLGADYRILGTSAIKSESVFAWSHLDESFVEKDFFRRPPNPHEFDFLHIDQANRKIFVKPGDFNLEQDLIIPEGYTVICYAGTRLNLLNSAKILSYSPFMFMGTEEDPIVIQSTEATGQGLVVIGAAQKSALRHVIFEKLSDPAQEGWRLTGAVTFYESPVDISHCQFLHSRSEDSLNIIRCDFTIERTLFGHSSSDAFDADFCKGSISDSSFVDCGNDAIDISGSVLQLRNIFINGAGDKGLSAGEDGKIRASQIEMKNAEIAVASKDMAEIIIDDISLSDCKVGFTCYQKKPEFGPAFITVKHIEKNNVANLFLVEERSKMVVGERVIAPNHTSVEQILYGVEYGKSSR